MKTNWAKTVNEINRERYSIPEGWDTREQVAEALQCAPDKVADILKPGIQSGDIERAEFPVWDENRRMTVRVTCFRKTETKETTTSPSKVSDKTGRIRAAILKHPNLSDRD